MSVEIEHIIYIRYIPFIGSLWWNHDGHTNKTHIHKSLYMEQRLRVTAHEWLFKENKTSIILRRKKGLILENQEWSPDQHPSSFYNPVTIKIIHVIAVNDNLKKI